MSQGWELAGNPKPETRNPKQIQTIRMTEGTETIAIAQFLF
jgi:hypothetical protein